MATDRGPLDESGLAALVQAACPPVSVPTPFRQDLKRRLTAEVERQAPRARVGWWWVSRPARVAVVLTAAAVVVVLAIALQRLRPTTPTMTPTTATLEVQTGTVTVRTQGASPRSLRRGETSNLRSGDQLEADSSGQARITFFPGQTTEIGPGTRLDIITVSRGRGTATAVAFMVVQGATTNRIQPPLPKDARFEASSPSLKVTATATVFRLVTVSPTRTYVAADEGRVTVSSDGKVATVDAGQHVVAMAGQELKVMPQPVGQATYVVQPGDTLGNIASRYGLTAQDLVDANPWIWNPDLILPGWRLVIPRPLR